MDLRQLVRAFDGGRIDADTLVWRKGMPDWRRLRDVTELAERLMGADAVKAATPEPAFEPHRSESAPPPRQQPERSRTPPADYKVSAGRGSSPPVEGADAEHGGDRVSGLNRAGLDRAGLDRAGLDRAVLDRAERDRAERITADKITADKVAADKDEVVVATLPGGGPGSASPGAMPATPTAGYLSPVPARTSSAPERRSVPSPAPASPARRSAFASAPPRTITQTGLAPAPDPAHRLVQRADAGEAPITEEPEATRAGAAAVASRASRTPAPSPRRVPSSDETPAQKPASLSVRSSALASEPSSRIGTKHLVALGGLLLGLGWIVSGALSERTPGTQASDGHGTSAGQGTAAPGSAAPTTLQEPAHLEGPVEKRRALVPEPSPAEPASAVAPAGAASESSSPSAPSVPAAAVRPARSAAPSEPARPAPVRPAVEAPILDIRPSSSEAEPASLARSEQAVPVTGRGELGAPATPPPPSSEPTLTERAEAPAVRTAPSPAPPSAAAPPAPAPSGSAPPSAAPAPAAPPSAAPPSAAPAPAAPSAPPSTAPPSASAPAAPQPFDVQKAKVQLGIAAFKASTCGSLGGARGAGDVTVVIEPFGRVSRVIHSNSAFVGTPSGTCVTQAYQQVQVAPFSGGAQTLTSSFVVP